MYKNSLIVFLLNKGLIIQWIWWLLIQWICMKNIINKLNINEMVIIKKIFLNIHFYEIDKKFKRVILYKLK